jgi:hypothetical protein
MTLRSLEAGPDVCLYVFQHVPDVNDPICIGKGAGHQDLSFFLCHNFLPGRLQP